MGLKQIFNSGKNPKITYYINSYLDYFMPKFIYQRKLKSLLAKIENHADKEYIMQRVNYYCKLNSHSELPDSCQKIGNHTPKKRTGNSVYFFDTYKWTKYFPNHLKWAHLPGDIVDIPEIPSIVKSRPIHGENQNSVLLNLDRIRHFIFLNDSIPFTEKSNMIIFRGKVKRLPARVKFMEQYFNHPMCDCGDTQYDEEYKEWYTTKKTLYEHLQYKFVMAIEGNDVASNLKWIMSSNSIAVMPRPKYETWFMEGKLIPNVHYIEVKEDFSDLIERVTYYINNPNEAQKIIDNAHKYVAQFKNPERERLISLATMNHYFTQTNSEF